MGRPWDLGPLFVLLVDTVILAELKMAMLKV